MQTETRHLTCIEKEYPPAADVAQLALVQSVRGKETDPAEALPQYVRDKVAKKMTDN